MSQVLVTESSLENIADAIRAKLGVATEYKPGEMAAAIASIPTGGGGGGNIFALAGTTVPTSEQGSNGDVYLKYTPNESHDGYTCLHYIQSSMTQYINTGVNATSNIAVEVAFSDYNVRSDTFLFGFRPGTWNGLGINNGGSGSMWIYYGGNGNGGTIATMTAGDIKLENGKRTIDGVETAFSETTFSYTYPIYIFAANNNGSPLYYSEYKLHAFKLWDDGTLIRDFIPVKRDSDNAIGLFDTVHEVFYGNAGSGAFTAGPDAPLNEITDAYLKVNGAWQALIGSSLDDMGWRQ